jgi:uncharacterized protein (TIGR00369 family)
MHLLKKPFEGHPDYKCFGCSPSNPIGLNLQFVEDGDYVQVDWEPREEFQGFINVLHGGIQATIMDELAAWCVNVKVKTAGVTKSFTMQYHKPAYVNRGNLLFRARLLRMEKNIAVIKTELFNHEGVLSAEGEFHYFTYPEAIAKRKLMYPGAEAFY